MKELIPYRFMSPGAGSFKVVVLAPGKQAAQAHVKWQGVSSLAWRGLSFVGRGHPDENTRKQWLVSVVRPVKS